LGVVNFAHSLWGEVDIRGRRPRQSFRVDRPVSPELLSPCAGFSLHFAERWLLANALLCVAPAGVKDRSLAWPVAPTRSGRPGVSGAGRSFQF